MDRGKYVFCNHPFGQQNSIFIVIAVPWHESDENVTSKSQITKIGRRTVSNDIALLDVVANTNQRTLVDTSRLVGTLEFMQTININARLCRIKILRCANNNTRCINLINNASTFGCNCCTRVTGNDRFHTGSDKRCFGANQRHSLTLHVGPHQSSVCIVIFKERNKRCCNRNQLLRRNVHEINVFTRSHQHFISMTTNDKFINEFAIIGQT